MKFRPSILLHLTKMICGDDPYKFIFPYRTGSALNEFFQSIDLNYNINGSSRQPFVKGILTELNERDNQNDPLLPSPEIVKVIEELFNFLDPTNQYYDEAIEQLNRILGSDNFIIKFDETKKGKLQLLKGHVLTTAIKPIEITKFFTFCPNVFRYPDNDTVDFNLVSVMMPFSKEFDMVHQTIQNSCENTGFNSKRVDDIWDSSVIVQDIFNLICKSSIVIADFSRKNPNVFYEVGIAHTLGKEVIPIVQNIEDTPFDLRHLRVLEYHDNGEGRMELQKGLEGRLKTLKTKMRKF